MHRFLLAIVLLVPGLAFAEEAPSLALELNALQPSDAGCRITFLATNGLGGPLDKTTFEVALFGAEGGLDRLVSLDFQKLTPGKTKVLQFELSGLDCTSVSRVLVNDVTACDGTEIAAAACLDHLTTSSRAKPQFGL